MFKIYTILYDSQGGVQNYMVNRSESKLLTVSQAAEFIGVHPLTLRTWSDKGLVPCCRTPGGHRRYNVDAIQNLLSTYQTNPTRALGLTKMVRTAIRNALKVQNSPDASIPLDGLKVNLDVTERHSLSELGHELLNLLIHYAIRSRVISGDKKTAKEQSLRSNLLRRGRQLGRSYGKTAERLGMRQSSVVATFHFFQQAILGALANYEEVDYQRFGRVYGAVLLAAVTAMEPTKPNL